MSKAKPKKPAPQSKASEVFNPLAEGNRCIYQFFDGQKTRRVDPLVVLDGLRKAEGVSFETDIKLIQAGAAAETMENKEQAEHFKKNAADATERVLGAARKVFGIEAYDGETDKGLTVYETLLIVSNFADFMGLLQEKARPLSNSPPSTAAESSGPSPTMKPTSGSTLEGSASKPLTS